jgi:hypothetical protein
MKVGVAQGELIEPGSARDIIRHNERNFRASGLQDFDAGEGERRRARRERDGVLNGSSSQKAKSAILRVEDRSAVRLSASDVHPDMQSGAARPR